MKPQKINLAFSPQRKNTNINLAQTHRIEIMEESKPRKTPNRAVSSHVVNLKLRPTLIKTDAPLIDPWVKD